MKGGKRTERMIIHKGRIQNLTAWAKEVGVAHTTIARRLAQGFSVEQALYMPKGTHNGA